ncbi:MAG: carbon starvation protein A [Firmicutes bacterium]|nr:carbon starvation protein A [Bacillota bacterium]
MSVAWIIFVGLAFYVVAYKVYGDYLEKKVLKCNGDMPTPAQTINDGVDYVPTKAPVLMGHHFASIAGAGPIVGPVSAAVFGWVPVALWVIFGSIFVGGVHDFAALVSSIRHEGKSIGQVILRNVGKRGQTLFLLFSYLALVLVVAVFTILVMQTFVAVPAVATTSILFMALAVGFGMAVYRYNVRLGTATIVGVILLFTCVFLGVEFPFVLDKTTWIYLILFYVYLASVLPVWILLQPRDYLNSFLLYASLIAGVTGVLIGHPNIQYPAFTSFYTKAGGYLFPMLFITVACGAVSGFHSLVSSGTTAKQVANERDTKVIGYGAMLIEGLVALLALSTVAYLTQQGYAEGLAKMGGPTGLYAAGIGHFMSFLGVPVALGTTFGALALNAFCLTSLDTATRLARYSFEEFFGDKVPFLANKHVATLVTVALAGTLALSGRWSAIWPIFGASNQLLAGLALLAASVWLMKIGSDNKATVFPMLFMFVVTVSGLVLLVRNNLLAEKPNYVLGLTAVALLILAVFLIIEAGRQLVKPKENKSAAD